MVLTNIRFDVFPTDFPLGDGWYLTLCLETDLVTLHKNCCGEDLIVFFFVFFFFHKQYFIKAIRQNPKTDYIKPSRRKKYLQKKKRENKNIQINSTK